MGRRKLKCRCRESLRQTPAHGHRKASVAWIDPVGVPRRVRRDMEPEGHYPSVDRYRGLLRNQLRPGVVRPHWVAPYGNIESETADNEERHCPPCQCLQVFPQARRVHRGQSSSCRKRARIPPNCPAVNECAIINGPSREVQVPPSRCGVSGSEPNDDSPTAVQCRLRVDIAMTNVISKREACGAELATSTARIGDRY